MNNLYLVNFSTGEEEVFGEELKAILLQKGIPAVRLSAEDFLIDLGDGGLVKPHLITQKDGVLHVENTLFFIKKRERNNNFFSSLLAQFIPLLGAINVNPLFAEHSKNVGKFSQGITFIAQGYRIPRTLLAHHTTYKNFKEYIESQLSYPLVLKASGSGGEYVWQINSFSEIEKCLAGVKKRRKEVIALQEFIKTSHEEFRVVFFNGKPLATIRRASEEFYNNYAQGASVTAGEITSKELALCTQAAEFSGLIYCGVDFMRRADGEPCFLELQTGPSISVSKIVNPNVISDIAEQLQTLVHQIK